MSNQATEIIWAKGHPNILATHPTTLMFTKDIELTKNGDCIVGICADKSVTDLSAHFKIGLRKPNATLTITIEADGLSEKITALGAPTLCLCHPTDIVIRKSDYVCLRTLAVFADKAADDLPRELVAKLQNPGQKIKVTLCVES